MTSKGKEPPQFIVFAAQVFTSLLVSAGSGVVVTPEVLRRMKMGQQTVDDDNIVDIIGCELDKRYGKTIDESKSRLEAIAWQMRSSQYWVNFCLRRLISMISKNCPNVIHLGGFLKEDAVLKYSDMPLADVEFSRYVEAQYASITNKAKQLRLAEESRIGMLSELALLLKEAGVDQEEEVLSASLLQNIAEGGALVDDFMRNNSKTRGKRSSLPDSDTKCGSDILHLQYGQYLDLINMFECQLQYEDIFWKWLLPPKSDEAGVHEVQTKLATSLSALEGVLFATLMTSKPSGTSHQDSLKAAIEQVDKDVLERLINQDTQSAPSLDAREVREDIVDRIMRHCILSSAQYCCGLNASTNILEDLSQKRELWREIITELIKMPNPHCPYDMILK